MVPRRDESRSFGEEEELSVDARWRFELDSIVLSTTMGVGGNDGYFDIAVWVCV